VVLGQKSYVLGHMRLISRQDSKRVTQGSLSVDVEATQSQRGGCKAGFVATGVDRRGAPSCRITTVQPLGRERTVTREDGFDRWIGG
jgi:hypothetical protein